MLGANQTAPASEAHPDPSIDAWTHAVHTIAASLVADDEILQVLGKGQSILIPAGSDALPATLSSGHHLRALAEANLGSAIIAPLTARGRMLGTMVLLTASGHYQTAAEQALAEELAQRAALSVDNARLYREAQRELAERRKIEAELREQTEVVETINRIGATLSAELDLQRLVQAVTDAATEVSGAQFGAFFFNQTGDDGERMTLYTLSGVPREAFAHYPLPRNTALFGPTFRGEGVIRIDDVLVDPRYGQNPPHHGMPPGHVPVRSYLAVPVISRSGEVLGGLFFGHAQPRIFTERVEQVVVGLAAQTAIAMDNARLFLESQQAIQARDHFLSMAAHELKTPVTAILGYAQLLAQRAERSGEADPRQARRLQTLLGQVVRMERLVHGLLDLSRLHLSVFTLDRAPVDLGALIKQLVEMLRSTLNRHTIDVRLDTGSHVVDGDEVRLEQVFQNILQNAIKYSPEGGPIDITVEHRGGDVCVTIRDRGIGIPASALPEIFKRFYRAGNAAAGHMAGMGVGLYVVHEIVTLHGGRIEVESEEGHGSCFRVFLLAAGTGSTT
jgi:signal transduction histidine kinase